jgi:hypothetical protein
VFEFSRQQAFQQYVDSDKLRQMNTAFTGRQKNTNAEWMSQFVGIRRYLRPTYQMTRAYAYVYIHTFL